MKVRKFLFAGALIAASLFSVNSVMAEDVGTPTRSASASVTVNLKFQPIQTIIVNPTDNEVDLTYAAVADYSEGKTSGILEDHINIYSTGGFEVKVNTNGNFVNTKDNTKFIEVKDVLISATAGKNAPKSTYAVAKGLTIGGHTLVSSKIGGININYSVEYDNKEAGRSNNYINKYINNNDKESVYSTTVTYTIAAQ